MRNRLGWIVLTVGFIAIVITGYFLSGQRGSTVDVKSKDRPLTGVLEATEVKIGFKIPGKVAGIAVKEGDTVTAGAVVAMLESQEIAAQLAQAKASVAAARAALNKAASDWQRFSELYQQGAISAAQRDAIETARLVAEAQLKQAEAAEQAARAMLDNTVVRSPVTGTVTLRAVEPGEMVNAGMTVLVINDLSDMWVKVYMDDRNVGKVKIGQQASVTVDSFPGQVFSGAVAWISDAGEFAAKKATQELGQHDIRAFAVKVRVENTQGVLKPGMTAHVQWLGEGTGK